jgi:hypothetical protein
LLGLSPVFAGKKELEFPMATQSIHDGRKSKTGAKDQDDVFTHVRHALENLQFGTVTIVVQNGRVVQIERHEKTRLPQTE